jgi:DNA-binding SARP family transcriptional activator
VTNSPVHEPVGTAASGVAEAATTAVLQPLLQIRMLGSLIVRRADGTDVDRGEWRTGKVIDLLRLLALAGGEPVASKNLVAALWPGSDQQHGNASLRTAASQIRRIIGGDHVERSLSGLRLRHAWIDVTEFRTLATQAHQSAILGHYNAVRTAAREASELYRGDFGGHDDGAEWVQSERSRLSGAHQVLLCDGAEAAIELGLGHEGVDYAQRATTVDPFSERATRLLMRGHAAVGEVSLALREYERCRLLLADELGIDPSPPTRELHLALLRGGRGGTPPAQGRLGSVRPAVRPRPTPSRLPINRDAGGRLREAFEDCLPRREFSQARQLADEVLAMRPPPALAARALAVSSLPDILLGGARAGRASLGRACTFASQSGDDALYRRFEVLQCLVSHDLSDSDFPRRWALAAHRCENEPDVNWAWLMMRIAIERGDLPTAELAGRLPLATGAGALAGQLHQLAGACLLSELGERDAAVQALSTLIRTLDRAGSTLLIPEALARLVALQADDDVVAAEANMARLDRELTDSCFPREAYLRLIGAAAVQAARGRTAAAAAAAAAAAEVADSAGLGHLAAEALRICADHTLRAQTAARHLRDAEPLQLTLRMVAV